VPELTFRRRLAARVSRSTVFRRVLGPAHMPAWDGYTKVTDRELRVFALERA